jgi:hypothetical protein
MVLYHARVVDVNFGEPIRCPLGACIKDTGRVYSR